MSKPIYSDSDIKFHHLLDVLMAIVITVCITTLLFIILLHRGLKDSNCKIVETTVVQSEPIYQEHERQTDFCTDHDCAFGK